MPPQLSVIWPATTIVRQLICHGDSQSIDLLYVDSPSVDLLSRKSVNGPASAIVRNWLDTSIVLIWPAFSLPKIVVQPTICSEMFQPNICWVSWMNAYGEKYILSYFVNNLRMFNLIWFHNISYKYHFIVYIKTNKLIEWQIYFFYSKSDSFLLQKWKPAPSNKPNDLSLLWDKVIYDFRRVVCWRPGKTLFSSDIKTNDADQTD